jgi:tetratricopeptide (TPR) repeat protein
MAAARVALLTPARILEQVQADRLDFLTTRRRGTESRQRTLRATLDWSYQLLPESGQRFLASLSVFRGGWTLEAARAVCALSEGETLDLLTLLRNSSLLKVTDTNEGMRFMLLETIREYSQEKLIELGEDSTVRRRHRDHFVALAEQAEPELMGPDRAMWMERLQTEHDNLCWAIAWCETEEANAGTHLRLVGALSHFWDVRGYLDLGRGYLTKALGRAEASGPTAERAKALQGAGALAHRTGDYASAFQSDCASARTLFEESLGIYRELGDRGGIALSLNSLGYVAYSQDDYEAARSLLQQSLAMSRQLADRRGTALSLNILGLMAGSQGDKGAARALHEESLAIRRELRDKPSIAWSLYQLGNVALDQGDYEAARTLLQESLTLYREMGHPFILHVLGALGHVAREAEDYGRASALYRESLLLRRELGDAHEQTVTTACSLEDFAGLAGRQRQCERAVRLLGAAEALCATLGRTLPIAIAAEYERTIAAARCALSEEAFAAAWEAGSVMTPAQAVDYALQYD